MSETPEVPQAAPAPVPAEEQISRPAANEIARDQIEAQAAAAPAGDAGATVEQIRQQVTREVLLPMEEKFDQLMAELAKQSEQHAAEMKTIRGQLSAAQAAVGPPDAIKYATAVRERLETARNVAGLPPEHWAGVLSAAGSLEQAAKDAVGAAGEGEAPDTSKARGLLADVERFVTRGHGRRANVHVEHFPALLGDLEELGDALLKLAA